MFIEGSARILSMESLPSVVVVGSAAIPCLHTVETPSVGGMHLSFVSGLMHSASHVFRVSVSHLFHVSSILRLTYSAPHLFHVLSPCLICSATHLLCVSSAPSLIYSAFHPYSTLIGFKSQAWIVSQPSGLSDRVPTFRHVSA